MTHSSGHFLALRHHTFRLFFFGQRSPSSAPGSWMGTLQDTIRRLYLCGAGTHPGGGVMGAPGHNDAREILKDWRRIESALLQNL
jgi:phytoene dehydrogenase-like protein